VQLEHVRRAQRGVARRRRRSFVEQEEQVDTSTVQAPTVAGVLIERRQIARLIRQSKVDAFSLTGASAVVYPRVPYAHWLNTTRAYYRSSTAASITGRDDDGDSEQEIDPPWLHERMEQLLHDFTDLNDAETEMMIKWNHHVFKDRAIGLCLLPSICERFIRANLRFIVEHGLLNNFTLHLAHFVQCSMMTSAHMASLVDTIHETAEQLSLNINQTE